MTFMMLRCFIFLAASADADIASTLEGRGAACESSGGTCGSGFIQTRKMLGGQHGELGAEAMLAEVTAVSYNLYWWNVGANNNWNALWSRIAIHKPMDLIGFQECEDVARVVHSSGLSGFEFWQGPNKPQSNPAPLAWNTGVFAKLSGPGSVKVGQDQYGDRIVTWVRLRHLASNQALFFANTHGPLNGCGNDLGDNWVAAVNSHQESGDLVIMTGDFNCGIGSAAMNKIKSILPGGVDGGIDFILTRGMEKISGGSHNGYPSDHPLVKGSFSLADAGTAPPAPSATTTTAVVVTGNCYGELSNVAIDEGEGIGSMDTTSFQDCKQRCSETSHCKSFAFCPTFAGCYFKSKALAGNEPTREFEDCKTFYKSSCDGSSSTTMITDTTTLLVTGATITSATAGTAAPTTPTSSTTTTTNTPDTAESCYGELSHVAEDEGEGVGAMDATSVQECKQSCSESSQCQSFAYCPVFAGCYFKSKALAGSEPTKVLEDCKTYYKRSCGGSSSTTSTTSTVATTTLPTTAATTSAVATTTTTTLAVSHDCYGELSNVAIDEGEGAGSMEATSVQECKQRCAENSQCQSFAYCPIFASCWFKRKAFAGNEPTKVFEDCKTYYKSSCEGSSSTTAAAITAQPITTTLPATSAAPVVATTTTTSLPVSNSCYGELSHLAVDEGEGVGSLETTSLEECQQRCSESSQCQSFAFCPSFGSCWFKSKTFVGNELTRIFEDCRTHYKRSCTGTNPPSPSSTTSPASVTVMTYNTVYTGYPCCGSNTVPQFGRKINEVGPAVMGAQECQDKNLLASAAGYQVVPGTGFQNPILYDASKVSLVFGSGGWMDVPRDCYAERTVTWAKFTMRNGMGFYFFNTHLPHNGCAAQSRDTHAQIATMLLQKREQLGAANVPTAVVCDCNPFASSGSSSGSFESVLASGGIQKAYEARGTQGGYAGLDKIFASMDWTPSNGADHGTGSSDHPAITADLMLVR